MHTSTLIVRLIGLYLLVSNLVGLIQLQRFKTNVGAMLPAQNPAMGDAQLIGWVSLLIGLGATLFAGKLARLLTFDAEPTTRRNSFGDRLLD